jgi:hypothetical protein
MAQPHASALPPPAPGNGSNESRRDATSFLTRPLGHPSTLASKDGDLAVADVWLVGLSVAFFALAFALAAWLDRI